MNNKRTTRIWCQWGIHVVLFCLLTSCGATPTPRPSSDAYTFPVQPGTSAWKQFLSRQEMLAVVQVPEPQLSRMSTAGLVETVLQYPLYGDMNAYF